ncbi:NUDIX domain-containing protein [Bacillus sp. BRMEA1]|uniref:NUDIX hydrolase n=1 Tax=Neobacillus endophyticus TaxID=2738405 RepID=UPI00156475DF|nr:NUDIX domain-containing protein [Neobacillus endophyticus]NRD77087.1 NUDIX domain-containing protein [Neobacillus endophyticus]
MSEKLKIFDENRKEIGIAERSEVHKRGYWHETFHCWFVNKIDGIYYIYFQIRSNQKKDFPNLLDITAAGHIMANECVSDGIREVKEELGVEVSIEDLAPLGVMEDRIITDRFIDKEFGHVYLYFMKSTEEFLIDREEVSGVVKTKFKDFHHLCLRETEEIIVEGFELDELGEKMPFKKPVGLEQFVPHQKEYLETVVKLIANRITEGKI